MTTANPIEAAVELLAASVDLEFLQAWLGQDRFHQIRRAGEADVWENPLALCRALLALEGSGLLAGRPRDVLGSRTTLRAELLRSVRVDRVHSTFRAVFPQREVAEGLDIAEALAGERWVRGSRHAIAVTRATGLPDFFAGRREAPRGSIEEVDVLGALPPLMPFQRGILRAVRSALHEGDRVMVSSFTGTGKTRMGMEYIAEVLQAQESGVVVWLAQKAELVDQACDSIEALWPWVGQESGEQLRVIRYLEGNRFMPGDSRPWPCLVIGTTQQVRARLKAEDPFLNEALSDAKLLVVDEAHAALAEGHQAVIDAYFQARRESGCEAKLLGLTATPGRSDLSSGGESYQLAELFGKRMIIPDVPTGLPALKWFQDQGFLSRLRHETVDMSSVALNAGPAFAELPLRGTSRRRGFSQDLLTSLGASRRGNQAISRLLARLIGDGRTVLAYCCTIEQAEIVTMLLALQGIRAGLIHYKSDRRDRRETIRQFRSGELHIILNVEVLTTGFDAPRIDTIAMCRPTMSRILYEQMIGRGMRGPQMGGTEECTIYDLTGQIPDMKEPLAWEAFWANWNESAQVTQVDPDWTLIRAAVDDPA